MYAAISIDAEVPISFDAPGDISEILAAAERNSVPLTWLIYSSITRPEDVARYYHDHVMHRIPGSHELGLHVHFDDHRLENYEADPVKRRELIIRGFNVLQKYHVKPTSHRAGCWCLQASDITVLEEIGVLVDSSPCTRFRSGNHPGHGDWRGLDFRDPYRPSYSSLFEKGDAKLTIVPVCSSHEPNAHGWCDCGYLEYRGWPGMKSILDGYVKDKRFLSIGTHDGRRAGAQSYPQAEVMDHVVPYLRQRGFEFTTLTQMRNFWLRGGGDHG